jgi:hypothetical protein
LANLHLPTPSFLNATPSDSLVFNKSFNEGHHSMSLWQLGRAISQTKKVSSIFTLPRKLVADHGLRIAGAALSTASFARLQPRVTSI